MTYKNFVLVKKEKPAYLVLMLLSRLGKFYVTFCSYQHYQVVNERGKPPVMIGPAMLHSNKQKETFAILFHEIMKRILLISEHMVQMGKLLCLKLLLMLFLLLFTFAVLIILEITLLNIYGSNYFPIALLKRLSMIVLVHLMRKVCYIQLLVSLT